MKAAPLRVHWIRSRVVGALALPVLLAGLLAACASGPPPDTAAEITPQGPPPPAASSVPPPPAGVALGETGDAAAHATASATANTGAPDASLSPAQRVASARQAATQADVAAAAALQQQCSDIRSQIREQQIGEQEAPSTSVSEEIVDAKEAHSDQKIQKLQDQYDSLDCGATQGAPTHEPLMAAPQAPNGGEPPGAQNSSLP